jgi:hypothetical protein
VATKAVMNLVMNVVMNVVMKVVMTAVLKRFEGNARGPVLFSAFPGD